MNITNLSTSPKSNSDFSNVIDAINTATPGPVAAQSQGGFGALGQGDFLTLMVAHLQQQDPFEPVDNKEMLAQMAQFSSLAGSAETNATLVDIATKLDALIAVQTPQSFPIHTPAAEGSVTPNNPETSPTEEPVT
jgi:flagellar basal-body rod modification protein FlgD